MSLPQFHSWVTPSPPDEAHHRMELGSGYPIWWLDYVFISYYSFGFDYRTYLIYAFFYRAGACSPSFSGSLSLKPCSACRWWAWWGNMNPQLLAWSTPVTTHMIRLGYEAHYNPQLAHLYTNAKLPKSTTISKMTMLWAHHIDPNSAHWFLLEVVLILVTMSTSSCSAYFAVDVCLLSVLLWQWTHSPQRSVARREDMFVVPPSFEVWLQMGMRMGRIVWMSIRRWWMLINLLSIFVLGWRLANRMILLMQAVSWIIYETCILRSILNPGWTHAVCLWAFSMSAFKMPDV